MHDLVQVFDAFQSPAALGLPQNPLQEFLKLVVATLIGLVVTTVRKHQHGRPLPLPLEHAMMLLCLSGALMMVIIGNSLARALGIAGAATLIRFRTPVDDPRDTTLFLILVGLGMTAGVGAFALAVLATIFVCAFLIFLNLLGQNSPRHLELEVVAEAPVVPVIPVEKVLAASGLTFELHEMAIENHASVRYLVNVHNNVDLKALSDKLMAGADQGLRSITWSEKKWMRQ
jgi:hypothetical protein